MQNSARVLSDVCVKCDTSSSDKSGRVIKMLGSMMVVGLVAIMVMLNPDGCSDNNDRQPSNRSPVGCHGVWNSKFDTWPTKWNGM